MSLRSMLAIPVVMRIPEVIFDEVEITNPSACGKSEVVIDVPAMNAFSATKGYHNNKNYLNIRRGSPNSRKKW